MNQRCLRAAVNETLKAEGIQPRKVEVSIALVDDVAIQQLNAQYRKQDKPTDVLSFAQDEPAMPGMPRLLGDVVISVDTAARQAAVAGQRLQDEVCQLAIHGILHLLGYDDVTTEGYEEMVRKGAEIWQRVAALTAGPATDTPTD